MRAFDFIRTAHRPGHGSARGLARAWLSALVGALVLLGLPAAAALHGLNHAGLHHSGAGSSVAGHRAAASLHGDVASGRGEEPRVAGHGRSCGRADHAHDPAEGDATAKEHGDTDHDQDEPSHCRVCLELLAVKATGGVHSKPEVTLFMPITREGGRISAASRPASHRWPTTHPRGPPEA